MRVSNSDTVRTGWLQMTLGMVGFFGLYYVLFLLCTETTGIELPFGQLFAAYAIGRLLTAVGVTPGGLGVTETGTAAALVAWWPTKAAASARLSELVDAGLLIKQPYQEPGQRSRDEYVLTEAGTDLMPVVWSMFEWGRKHLKDSGLRLTHLDCGAEASVEIRCAEGHHVPVDELGMRLASRRAGA